VITLLNGLKVFKSKFLTLSIDFVSFVAAVLVGLLGGNPSFFKYCLRSYLPLINASMALLVKKTTQKETKTAREAKGQSCQSTQKRMDVCSFFCSTKRHKMKIGEICNKSFSRNLKKIRTDLL